MPRLPEYSNADMGTLPRHLILAAIVLTVCCAERQAPLSSPELAQVAAEIARTARAGENRVHRTEHHQVPSARSVSQQQAAPRGRPPLVVPMAPLASDRQVRHESYPSSRFRLPPPA